MDEYDIGSKSTVHEGLTAVLRYLISILITHSIWNKTILNNGFDIPQMSLTKILEDILVVLFECR